MKEERMSEGKEEEKERVVESLKERGREQCKGNEYIYVRTYIHM